MYIYIYVYRGVQILKKKSQEQGLQLLFSNRASEPRLGLHGVRAFVAM